MADRSIVVRLKAEVDGYRRAMREAAESTKGLGDESERSTKRASSALGALAGSARKNQQEWQTVGTAFMAVGAAAAVGAGLAIRSFANFDQAMSNVQAATHETASNMEALRKAAIEAGAATQYSATEAAGAIENLAKAGVSTKDILGGGLTGALNLAAAGQLDVADAAEIAATALTQFNLQGSDVNHVADLLAAGAGKAQGEVSDLSYALKQSGLVASQMGLSIEETTGTLAAFASAGLIGSDAGTSFRTMLLRLANPAKEASNLMDDLGISAYDAQGNFVGMENLAGQLQTSLGGLSQAQRDQALATIFGSDAIRAANVLYQQGSKGVADWTAKVNDQGYAAETAAAKTDNLAGDIERLGGAFDTALIQTGEGANGVLRNMVQGVTKLVDVYNDLPAPVQQGTLAVTGLVAAVGLAGGAVMVTVPKVVELYDAFGKLGPAGLKAQGAMRGMADALPTIGKVTAIATAFLAVGAAAAQISNQSRDAVPGIEATTQALLDMADAGDTAALNKLFAEGIDFQYLDDGTKKAYDLSEAFRVLTNQSWSESFNNTVGDFFGEVRANDQAAEVFDNIGQSLATMVQTGDADRASAQFDMMAKQLGLTGDQTDELLKLMPAYGEALTGVENKSRMASDASGEAGLAGGLSMTAEEAKEAADEVAKLIDKLTILNEGALSVTRAEVALQESFDAATKSARENGNTLDLNTDSGRENQSALLDVVDALNNKTVADYKNTASTQGVTAANDQLNAAMPGLRQRFIDVAVQMGINRQRAAEMADQYLKTPDQVRTDVQLIGDQYARTQMQGLGNDIQGLQSKGVQVEVALGPGAKKMATFMQLPLAKGGVVDYFADGAENHVAQIAPAGAWRVWAEPETGGEAYIPLAPQKRQRSLDIWQETGKRLGVQGFAGGGITRSVTAGVDADQDLLATRAGVRGMQNWIDAYGKKIGSQIADKLQPAGGPGMGWQAQWAALHAAFPWAQLTSSFRPGAITATGNASYHGRGRAIDVSPSMAIFDWIAANYPNATELIYSPAGGRQLWHGRPHYYGGVTRAMHFCVPLDVEILTRRGWVTYDQIVPGDETPGFNFETRQTEWTRIIGTVFYESAEVFEARSKTWTVRATAGHRWVTRDSTTDRLGFTRMDDPAQRTWVVAAPFTDGPGVDLSLDEAELIGWLLTDGSQWTGSARCSFEGCRNRARSKGLCGSHRRQMQQYGVLRPLRAHFRGAAPDFSMFVWQTKPAGVERLAAILGDRAVWNGKGYRLRNEYAIDLLRRAGIGHVKDGAALTNLAWRMTREQRAAMLAGVIGGDGHVTKTGTAKIYQDLGPLSEFIATLAYLCGHRAHVTKRTFTDGRKRNGVNMQITLSRPRVTTWRQGRRSLGHMPVWCPTTELGTWTARFDGNPVLTGNSHVHWAMKEGGILNPHVRDQGGPLLPGWTYNGTGRAEQVVPMSAPAASGSSSQRSFTFNVKTEREWTPQQALQLVARAEAMYL